ncbi:DNA polymerase IV [Aerococcaceae bacterium DSM 111020]|nr:DNA polymerase IV [Aerococcaceae bacterium DSM 111020]
MQYGILTFEEPQPDISRKILHVDMDAFYASIEMRDNPALRNKPVVIARHPRLTGGRGIVSTCNYEARKYGIHSAMSAVEAYKRCPQAVFVPGRHEIYRQESQRIHAIYRQYTDIYEPVALDEAYLDVTNNKKNIQSGTLLAKAIQEQIFEETGLTCSVGVSYNKFVAKIASDYHKPFGITVIEPKIAVDFLKTLEIQQFHGVGRKSVPLFHELGIYTGEDLYQQSLEFLMHHFGKMGYSLFFKVRGIQNTPVKRDRERKSIGKETTLSQFLTEEIEVMKIFERLTRQVAMNLIDKQLSAMTVTIKIRYEDFETVTRQMKHDEGIQQFEDLYPLVAELWQMHGHLNKSIRLLGVSVSNFENQTIQQIPLLDNL